MQVKKISRAEEVDDYKDITPEFKDVIFEHKVSGTGNPAAPYELNKEALSNLKFINFSDDSSLDYNILTYSNLAWHPFIGTYIAFSTQCLDILPKYQSGRSLKFDKIMLN